MNDILVWSYWEDIAGVSRPQYLDLCLQTIEKYCNRPPFKFNLVTPENLFSFLPDLRRDLNSIRSGNGASRNIAVKCDYVRISLLKKYGGIWVDFDSIFVAPLDSLIPVYRSATFDFAAIKNLTSKIANGFLMSKPDGVIINAIHKSQDEILSTGYRVQSVGILGLLCLTPIIYSLKDFWYNLTPIVNLSIWHHNREQYFQERNISDHIFSNVFYFQLYNSVFAARLNGITNDELLSKNWLISNLFKYALEL